MLLATTASIITIGQCIWQWNVPFIDSNSSPSLTPTSIPLSIQPSTGVPIAVPVSVPLPTPSPTPTAGPTATPTPVSPLHKQLEDALSMSYADNESEALLIVAQDAVLRMDYWTAIRAASATPYASEQAKNLGFVVRCAIEDGLYDLAAEAARNVTYSSESDQLKLLVIKARKQATHTVEPLENNRESMDCFN